MNSTVLAITAAGFLGFGLYLFTRRSKPTTQFRNLQVEFKATEYYAGQNVLVTVTLGHTGPGGSFDVGFGLAPAAMVGTRTVTDWYATDITLPESETWVKKEVRFIVQLPTVLGKRDVLKFIQVVGGDRDPEGEGFLLADWDRSAIEVVGTQNIRLQILDLTVAQ